MKGTADKACTSCMIGLAECGGAATSCLCAYLVIGLRRILGACLGVEPSALARRRSVAAASNSPTTAPDPAAPELPQLLPARCSAELALERLQVPSTPRTSRRSFASPAQCITWPQTLSPSAGGSSGSPHSKSIDEALMKRIEDQRQQMMSADLRMQEHMSASQQQLQILQTRLTDMDMQMRQHMSEQTSVDLQIRQHLSQQQGQHAAVPQTNHQEEAPSVPPDARVQVPEEIVQVPAVVEEQSGEAHGEQPAEMSATVTNEGGEAELQETVQPIAMAAPPSDVSLVGSVDDELLRACPATTPEEAEGATPGDIGERVPVETVVPPADTHDTNLPPRGVSEAEAAAGDQLNRLADASMEELAASMRDLQTALKSPRPPVG